MHTHSPLCASHLPRGGEHSAGHTCWSHPLPYHPSWQTQVRVASSHRPRSPHAGSHRARSQRSPPHPSSHTQSPLAGSHVPWTHAGAHAAPRRKRHIWKRSASALRLVMPTIQASAPPMAARVPTSVGGHGLVGEPSTSCHLPPLVYSVYVARGPRLPPPLPPPPPPTPAPPPAQPSERRRPPLDANGGGIPRGAIPGGVVTSSSWVLGVGGGRGGVRCWGQGGSGAVL